MTTRDRILDAALVAFGTRGFEATSLDGLAAELKITKQTILYYEPSKDALLRAVINRSANELAEALEASLSGAGRGFARVEAVVRSVFRVALRRPELLGLLKEVSRLGPPAAGWLMERLDPLVARATAFSRGDGRGHDAATGPPTNVLSTYSTVGGGDEVECSRGGIEPTSRSLVKRRRELMAFLQSALEA